MPKMDLTFSRYQNRQNSAFWEEKATKKRGQEPFLSEKKVPAPLRKRGLNVSATQPLKRRGKRRFRQNGRAIERL